MRVDVAYAEASQQLWMKLEVDEGCTAAQAIEQSGILKKCPEIDLESQKIGIFGKGCKLDTELKEGDRVEIYRPITADPETVERRDEG